MPAQSSMRLSASIDHDVLWVIQEACRLTEAAHAELVAVEANELRVIYTGSSVQSQSFIHNHRLRYDIAEGITGLVARKGESLLVDNIENYKEIYLRRHLQTCSELAVPVKDQRGKVVAVLNLEHHNEGHFRQAHLNDIEDLLVTMGTKCILASFDTYQIPLGFRWTSNSQIHKMDSLIKSIEETHGPIEIQDALIRGMLDLLPDVAWVSIVKRVSDRVVHIESGQRKSGMVVFSHVNESYDYTESLVSKAINSREPHYFSSHELQQSFVDLPLLRRSQSTAMLAIPVSSESIGEACICLFTNQQDYFFPPDDKVAAQALVKCFALALSGAEAHYERCFAAELLREEHGTDARWETTLKESLEHLRAVLGADGIGFYLREKRSNPVLKKKAMVHHSEVTIQYPDSLHALSTPQTPQWLSLKELQDRCDIRLNDPGVNKRSSKRYVIAEKIGSSPDPIGFILIVGGRVGMLDESRIMRSAGKSLEGVIAHREMVSDFADLAMHELGWPIVRMHDTLARLRNGELSGDEVLSELEYRMDDINLAIDSFDVLAQITTGDTRCKFKRLPSPISAIDVMRHAVLMQQDTSQIKIITEGEDEKLTVCGEKKNLTLLFNNVVGNAVKHKDGEGAVEVSMWREGLALKIRVTNPCQSSLGPEKHKLGNAGVRGSNTAGIPGYGLGLWLCKELVNKMGGEMEISSQRMVTKYAFVCSISLWASEPKQSASTRKEKTSDTDSMPWL